MVTIPRRSDIDLSDTQIKMRIGYALCGRLSTISSAIIHNITHSMRVIEELPAVAIEAMLEYSREQHRADRPRREVDIEYKNVRAALLLYGEACLREAQKRERRLLHGITGAWEDLSPDEGYSDRPKNNGDEGEGH